MRSDRPFNHWLALTYLAVAWGSSFAFTKIAVQSVAPIWIPAARIVIAAAILFVVLKARGGRLPRGRDNWAWLVALGAIGTLLPFIMVSWATLHAPSSMVGILMTTNPLMVLILVQLFLPGEPVRPRHVAGFVMGFAGVVFLMGTDTLLGLNGKSTVFWAGIAALAAAFCYAAQTVIARLAPEIDLLGKSAGALVAIAPLAVLAALVSEPAAIVAATPQALLAILFLAVAPTAIAMLVLFWLVGNAGARFLSMSNYLVPVVATAIGVVIMSEHLGAEEWIGLALILTGILISEGRFGRLAAAGDRSGN